MSTIKQINAYVQNSTGGTINTYWVEHAYQSTSNTPDYGYGTNLANGGNGPTFGLSVAPGKSAPDYWTVTYVDANNNVYVSDRFFEADLNGSGRTVTLNITAQNTVEISQALPSGKESHAVGNSGMTEIGQGTNTPSV